MEQDPPLWDRRAFLTAMGAGLGTVSGLTAAGAADKPDVAPSASIVVADTRFPTSLAFAHEAARSGARIVRIDGDVTNFWYDELDLLWRKDKVTLAGVTAYGAFFCLERLAMDRGLHVVFKRDRSKLIHWVIAPKPEPGSEGDIA